MRPKRPRFSRVAGQDLSRLRAFVAAKNPRAAAAVSRRLREVIRRPAARPPKLGRPLEELAGIRELLAGDDMARYTVTEETVIVLRVRHGEENRR